MNESNKLVRAGRVCAGASTIACCCRFWRSVDIEETGAKDGDALVIAMVGIFVFTTADGIMEERKLGVEAEVSRLVHFTASPAMVLVVIAFSSSSSSLCITNKLLWSLSTINCCGRCTRWRLSLGETARARMDPFHFCESTGTAESAS